MNRKPREWTRKELAKLDFMHTYLDISIEALAVQYNKSPNAIKIQLDRLAKMHNSVGTSFNEWNHNERLL